MKLTIKDLKIEPVFEKYRHYLFVFLLLAVFAALDYQTILFLPPQGFHFIRQTDCLSFVSNYYKNGYNFFEPHVYNLQSTNGKAACEFPILYFITAILYRLFGEHEFFLRLITVIIVSIGFFYLFRLLYEFLKDLTTAVTFCFLFLSSTVLLYNANNFLPDASALGLTLTGWYFFFTFFKNRKSKRSLFLSFLLFLLASLLKVTFFINPVTALLSVIVIVVSNRVDLKSACKQLVFPLMFFLMCLMPVVLWNLFVVHYNKFNHDYYFLVGPCPVWSLDSNEKSIVWNYILNYWYPSYYYQSAAHVLLLIIFAGLFFIKSQIRVILIPTFILAIGSICYFLLFFAQFRDHDYYFIALIPAIILLTVNSFVALKNKFPGFLNLKITKFLLVILCCFSLHHAREKLYQRYHYPNDRFAAIGLRLAGTGHYLDSIGVPENAKFVIITDQTPNGGLYFIRRPGWNIRDTSVSGKMELENYIGRGADYILFTSKNHITNSFQGIKVGEEKGNFIYKLSTGSFVPGQ